MHSYTSPKGVTKPFEMLQTLQYSHPVFACDRWWLNAYALLILVY